MTRLLLHVDFCCARETGTVKRGCPFHGVGDWQSWCSAAQRTLPHSHGDEMPDWCPVTGGVSVDKLERIEACK